MVDLTTLDNFRAVRVEVAHFGGVGNSIAGCFGIPSPTSNQLLRVIASNAEGWDHVSVSLPNRCPNWLEMERVKRMFFKSNETAMQLHVPPDDHISIHPNCLHLWRPHDAEIPRPPGWMVGPKPEGGPTDEKQ